MSGSSSVHETGFLGGHTIASLLMPAAAYAPRQLCLRFANPRKGGLIDQHA
jgi:hypothetical protein